MKSNDATLYKLLNSYLELVAAPEEQLEIRQAAEKLERIKGVGKVGALNLIYLLGRYVNNYMTAHEGRARLQANRMRKQ